MLRLVVILLLLANGGFYAWSQGLLLPLGMGPAQQAEPQRLAQQVRPEAMRIATGDEAKRLEASAAAPRPAECMVAGPLDEAAAEPLRQALQSWPPSAWTLEPVTEPARWIVYMGKYAAVENVTRKKAELRQLGVSFETLSNPALELGLSLGGFATEGAANQHLERLAERGVRTARVVQERPELRGQRLLLPALDEGLRARLDELRPLLNGRPLRPCR
ncbi:MAG TPA: SPOR domain-containing protein [Ramlibacter sp.]|nr:SPOR domain-containing protein [Ramlibacter sp.]